MASDVSICNLALAYLGDNATVANLSPPEGSAQAEHCARFYPMARDLLLEGHPWNFASKRLRLAAVVETGAYAACTEWTFAYLLPADAVNVVAVLRPSAPDDYRDGATAVPQPYQLETQSDGQLLLRTDVEAAELRYTARLTDPTKFSPLFTQALVWQLAAMLAGPILKGEAGAAESKRCLQLAGGYLAQAKISDAAQRQSHPPHVVPWMAGR